MHFRKESLDPRDNLLGSVDQLARLFGFHRPPAHRRYTIVSKPVSRLSQFHVVFPEGRLVVLKRSASKNTQQHVKFVGPRRILRPAVAIIDPMPKPIWQWLSIVEDV